MAFFDKLGKKLEGMVQDAHEYTSDMIEVNRLNGNIRTEREAIDDLHKRIGVAMHRLYQAGEAVPDDVRPELEEITARLEKIVDLESRIEDAKRNREAQATVSDRPAETIGAEEAMVVGRADADHTDRMDRMDRDARPAVPLHADERMAAGQTDADRTNRMDRMDTADRTDAVDRTDAEDRMGTANSTDRFGKRSSRDDDTIEIDVPLSSESPRTTQRYDTSAERDEAMARGTSKTGAQGQSFTPAGMGTPTEADIVNEQPDRMQRTAASGTETGSERTTRRFCTNCGQPLAPGKPFCGNCGQRND